MVRAVLDTCVLFRPLLCDTLYELDPTAVHRGLSRQVSGYRRQPRTVADLLVALGGRGNGCEGFAGIGHTFL